MNHWPILPVLLPALTAGLLALANPRPSLARAVSLASCAPWRVVSLASNSVSVLHAVFSLYFWASP